MVSGMGIDMNAKLGYCEQDLKDMLLERDPPLEKKEQTAIRFALHIIQEHRDQMLKLEAEAKEWSGTG